jgi:hypothetical protein
MFVVLYDIHIINTCAGLNQPIITHYFSRMSRTTEHGRITFIPSGNQLKIEIHRFNRHIQFQCPAENILMHFRKTY